MNNITCPHCGTTYPDDGYECPTCGRPEPDENRANRTSLFRNHLQLAMLPSWMEDSLSEPPCKHEDCPCQEIRWIAKHAEEQMQAVIDRLMEERKLS